MSNLQTLATSNFDYQNFFSTTLSGDINDTTVDIVLNSVPTPTEGTLVIDWDVPAKREVIYYTSKTASKVVAHATYGRGFDSSTAVSHTQGAKVIMAPIGEWFRYVQYLATTTPVGTVLDYAGSSAPSGFLLCYGQTLDSVTNTEYADLYTAIGTTYGGTGADDFNVPDLRGRVVAGQDDMGGTSADRLTDQSGGLDGDVLGDTGGSETHTLTVAELATHTHTRSTGDAYFYYDAVGAPNTLASGANFGMNTATTTGNAGSSSPHNNVQPTIILNKIIKY